VTPPWEKISQEKEPLRKGAGDKRSLSHRNLREGKSKGHSDKKKKSDVLGFRQVAHGKETSDGSSVLGD